MYTITETKLKSEESTIVLDEIFEVENLEDFRNELHNTYNCDRVLFTYDERE